MASEPKPGSQSTKDMSDSVSQARKAAHWLSPATMSPGGLRPLLPQMRPPSIRLVRRAIAAGLLLAAMGSTAQAQYDGWPAPPRPISAAAFQRLLAAVKAESFSDGKPQQVRAVAAGKRYLFAGGQVIAVLDAFGYWTDRLEALRLLPLVDRAGATAVKQSFDAAPATIRSEAGRILGVGD